MIIEKVVETDEVVTYLESRNILTQYRKSKQHLLAGEFNSVRLKKRQPKTSGIWHFRITKKYRAMAWLESGTLKVFDIDDRQ